MFAGRLSLMMICLTLTSLASASDAHPVGSEPGASLRWLMNGNVRFQRASLRNDGQGKKDVLRLSSGQKPHAIVLSCSDSRVPPEIVFDQKLGEIFVVRTAGEALNDNVIGSIEYAVEHLGSQLIVVMGHTSCGAVKAAMATRDGGSAGTPALDGLVKDIHPRLAGIKGEPSAGLKKEGWANAQGVARDLVARSALLKKSWEAGKLWVVPSLYNMDSGAVEFQDRLQAPVNLRAPASGSH